MGELKKMKEERSKGNVRMGIATYFQICTQGAQTLTKKVEHFKMSWRWSWKMYMQNNSAVAAGGMDWM